MSLLPSFLLDEDIEQEAETEEEEIEELQEYGLDFETEKLTGEIVTGVEALKVWAFLALHCERYRWPIYSWDYGAELDQYIGQNYSSEYVNSAVKKDVTDCLLQNDHIKDVRDFKASFEGDTLTMSMRLETDMGEVEVNV